MSIAVTLSPGHCTRLADLITQAGGTVPADLADSLARLDAVNAWEPPQPTDIASLCRRGELTVDNAAEILNKALLQPNRQPGELKVAAKHNLAHRFADQVNGTAGDEIIATLRPIFDEATKKVAAAAEIVGPGMTGDQAIEIGNKAVAAWKVLPEQRRILDTIHAVVESLIGDFEVLGNQNPWMERSNLRLAAFYAPNVDTNPFTVAAGMASNNMDRAGRWHRTASFITLNAVTQAREILAAHEAAHIEAAQKHYNQTHGLKPSDVPYPQVTAPLGI